MAWVVGTDGSLAGIRGDNLRIPLEFYEDDNVTPIDLTGYTVRSQVRSKPGGYIMLDLEVSYPDRTLGQVVLSATHEATQALRLTSAWWDVEVQDPSGAISTEIGPAPVTITRDVTVLAGEEDE